MKSLVLLFLLTLINLSVSAQKRSTPKLDTQIITGKVVDSQTKEPVPYASISLKDQDLKIITGSITNEQGEFKLAEVPAGRYSLEAQFLGYHTIVKEINFIKSGTTINVGTLLLLPDAARLKEVVVTGEKSAVSLKLDKKVFEVGKDILAQSGSANEVLNNVPSVAVSPAGVVSLRGNNNVLILINGRRSGLTLSNALDQVPADQIARVEVITNPSARYDAAGSAGIINIILKKNIKTGFSGQVRLVSGLPRDARINPGLNYKSNKINVFSTIGYRQTDYVGFYKTNQTTTDRGIATILNRTQNEDRHDEGKLLYLGADYFINAQNTLTAAFFKNATRDTDQTTLQYQYGSFQRQLDSTIVRTGHSTEIRDYNQLEFNYTKTYQEEGKKLTADIQYDFWNSNKTWNLATQKLFPVTTTIFPIRTHSVGSSKDFLLRTDFIEPLSANSTLELGLKVENRLITSNFKAEELFDANWQIMDNIDNALDYNERIGGAYVQYSNKINKFSYLLGLRHEFTQVKIQDRADTFTNEKDYQRLFPTVNVSYAYKEETTVQASYSKRINRPYLSLLYPFNELTDLNAQFVGNPALNPAYTNAFELSLLRHNRTFTLNPSVYFQHTTNSIQFYTFRNTAGVFITSPYNLDKEIRAGLELATTYNPFKWLQLNGDLNLFTFKQHGIYQEQDFAFVDNAWNTRVNAQVKLPRKFTFQGRFNFAGAQNNAQSQTRALYYVDVGLSKNLLQDKATLVLDGSNVFNSRQTRTLITSANYRFYQNLNYNAARYRLSFVYRLNTKEGQSDRQAKSGNRN